MPSLTQLFMRFCTVILLSTSCMTHAISEQDHAPVVTRHTAFDVTVVGTGQPIVLIPGLSSSASVWDETVAALTPDYQLHILQLAGFAGTPAASYSEIGQSYLSFQKQAIINYIREQQLRDVVVIGHSLGGFLALWIASEQSEELAGVVNIDGLPALGVLMRSYSTTHQPQSENQGNYDPVNMVKTMANNTAWHQRILNDMMTSDPATSGRAMGELMKMDIRPQLTQIAVPVLTLGAPAQGQPYASYEQTKQGYLTQFSSLSDEVKQMAYAPAARHFIMADEPKWMLEQIRHFLISL